MTDVAPGLPPLAGGGAFGGFGSGALLSAAAGSSLTSAERCDFEIGSIDPIRRFFAYFSPEALPAGFGNSAASIRVRCANSRRL